MSSELQQAKTLGHGHVCIKKTQAAYIILKFLFYKGILVHGEHIIIKPICVVMTIFNP